MLFFTVTHTEDGELKTISSLRKVTFIKMPLVNKSNGTNTFYLPWFQHLVTRQDLPSSHQFQFSRDKVLLGFLSYQLIDAFSWVPTLFGGSITAWQDRKPCSTKALEDWIWAPLPPAELFEISKWKSLEDCDCCA